MRGGPRLAGLPSSRHAVNRRLRLPDLRTGEDSPLSTTFRRSNRKICRSQWLSTPRRPRSDRNATFPTRSPRSIACWPSRLQRPFIDASVAPVAFRGTGDGIYDAVVLDDVACVNGAGRDREGYPESKKVWQIVGEPEADVKNGKISVTSPIARALIGKTKGATVEVEAPGGAKGYKIRRVQWPDDS